MKLLQRFLMGLGTVLLLALSLQLFAPKAVHAVVSTLVTVANTAANPAVTLDANVASRIPYESFSTPNGPNGTCGSTSDCGFTAFTPAPPGYRLVVQQISGVAVYTAAVPTPIGSLSAIHNGVGTRRLDYFFGTFDGRSVVTYHQNVIDYLDSGDAPVVELIGNMDPANGATMMVTGYLENCAVTGCPPVQH